MIPLLVLLVLLAPLVPRTAFADTPAAFKPPTGMSIQAGQSTAGSTESGVDASIDPTTGAFRTSIAFALPAARGAVQPSLALTYDSSGGFGIGGRGWSLALPSIERHNPSGPPQFKNDPVVPGQTSASGGAVNPDVQDRFEFGGQPLIEVCYIGPGGACTYAGHNHDQSGKTRLLPGEQLPSFTTNGNPAGWHYYRLQTDNSLLQRFFWSPDHRTWVVQDKTGATAEYTAGDGDGGGGIFRWNLTKKYDAQRFSSAVASGAPPSLPVPNLISYVWTPMAPANGVSLEYLTDIYDTPKAGVTSPDTSSFAHHTHLVYTALPQWSPSIIAPVWKASPTFVLTRVDVTSQDLSATAARQQVRRYYLEYTSFNPPPGSPFVGLTSEGPPSVYSVQLEGNCSGAGGWTGGTANHVEVNGQLPDPSTSGKCPVRPPTIFTYAPISYDSEPLFTPQGVVMPSLPSGVTSPLLFDIDNNGLPDVLAPSASPPVVWLNTGTGFGASQALALGTPSASPAPLNTIGQLAQRQYVQTGRFQMDGRIDMMWTDVTGAQKITASTYPDPIGNPPGKTQLYNDTPVNYELLSVSPPNTSGTTGSQAAWTLTPSGTVSTFGLLLTFPAWLEPTAAQGGPGLEQGCAGQWAFSLPEAGYLKGPVDEVFALGSEESIAGMDIDGDGIVDLLGGNGYGQQIETPQSCADTWAGYTVRFSKRAFDYSYAPFFGNAASSATSGTRTDVCIGGLAADQQKADSATANTFGDIDGDGIVDFIRWASWAATGSQEPESTWWPGHGDGTFGMCPGGIPGVGATSGAPLSCSCGSAVGIALPFNVTAGSVAAIHDVTGDGLGDVIIGGPFPGVGVTVYPNLGYSAGGHPAFGEGILVPVNSLLGWGGTASPTALYFADMNGSGVDDIIVQQVPAGGSVATALGYIDLYTGGAYGTKSLRPGLLTDINNGLGLATHVAYGTTTQLGNQASPPWSTPQPVHVVTSITTSDSTSDSYTTSYTYSGPVFDGHDNTFLGFQKVRTTTPGDASQLMNTETTYFYSACTGPGGFACSKGTSYLPASYRGLPTLTEVFDGTIGFPTYLSTTHHSYAGQSMYMGSDDRASTYVYEQQTDTFVYDTSPFVGSSKTQLIADVDLDADAYPPAAVPVRGAVARHLRTTRALDAIGNLTSIVDSGDIGDISATPPDPAITRSSSWGMPTKVDTSNNWIWRPMTTTTGASASDPMARVTTLAYDPHGNLLDVTQPLAGTVALSRSSFGTGAPLDASGISGTAHLVHITYDSVGMGNPMQVEAYPSATSNNEAARCTEYNYDTAYAQLRTTEMVDVGDCGIGTAIATHHVYDRVLNVETSVIAPAGGTTAATYDAFGRLLTMTKPDPTTGMPPLNHPSRTVAYADTSYGQLVHTEQAADPAGNYVAYDSYTYLDAFGRTLQVVSTADGANQWVVSGQVLRDARGRVAKAFVPRYTTATDPTSLYSNAAPTGQAVTATYDAFGRIKQTADIDGTLTSTVRYHAMSVESRDAEQSLTSGVHVGAYLLTTRDGHGRTVQLDEHEHTSGILSTAITYQATGETTSIKRFGTNGNGVSVNYARSMQYDTLGRLVKNTEPNVGVWTYAYNDLGNLVATVDARGCGKNLTYDGAGRLLSEDFSPCEAPPMQMAYTAPSANGDGTEAFYVYEGGALQTGAVSDVYDRASHNHFHHDLRGRATQVDRQLAGPGTDPTEALSVPSALSARYSSVASEYSRVTTYDDRDRPRTQTTGAFTVDFLATDGTSAVTGTYSPRGFLESVTSSYGPIITGATFEADGRPDSIQYADPAKTTITYSYIDSRNRLSETKIWRAGAFPQSQGSYKQPDPSSAQPTQQVVVADDWLPSDPSSGLAAYDGVGNPMQINDRRPTDLTQWPSGYQPVNRSFTYDDSYRLLATTQYFSSTSGADAYQAPTALATVKTSPVPLTSGGNRVSQQAFTYDGLGDMLSSTDKSQTFFDRSLGTITPGTSTNTLAPGPNQLASAALTSSANNDTGNLNATYDKAGNLVQLAVQRDTATCNSTAGCNQLYQYDWDEVGRLARARRFDFVGGRTCRLIGRLLSCSANPLPSAYPYPSLPTASPNADVSYAYDAGGSRVLRGSVHAGQATDYTAEIFPSLRLDHAQWLGQSYELTDTTVTPYLALGSAVFGRVVYNPLAPSLPSSTERPSQHVFLELSDALGSTSAVIDRDTSELVERSTYLAYGALESDYQPSRWQSYDGNELQCFAEDYKFTGKENDAEIGLTYFGARYYSPQLGRWISPDPLAIHAAGADLNPYAYVGGRVMAAVDPNGLDENNNPDPTPPPAGTPGAGGPSDGPPQPVVGTTTTTGNEGDPVEVTTTRDQTPGPAFYLTEARGFSAVDPPDPPPCANFSCHTEVDPDPWRMGPPPTENQRIANLFTLPYVMFQGPVNTSNAVRTGQQGQRSTSAKDLALWGAGTLAAAVGGKFIVGALATEGLETAAVNGNSLLSQNAQHVYEILQTDAEGNVQVFKYGISGGPLNAAGLSVRAETQVSALTRAAGGEFTYESSIVQMIPGGAGARGAALTLERQLVYDYLGLTGAKPLGNLRP